MTSNDFHDRDRQIAMFSLTNGGYFSLDDARGFGFTPSSVRRRVESGRWERIGWGRFRITGVEFGFDSKVAAVLQRLAPTWLSHATAARVWGWTVEHRNIEVTVESKRRPMRGVDQHLTRHLLDSDRVMNGRWPVTSPVRTLIDLSGRLALRRVSDLLDDGLRRRLISLHDLQTHIVRTIPAPGRRPSVLAALIAGRDEAGAEAESALEDRVYRVLRNPDLPVAQLQFPVVIAGRSLRLDFAYPKRMVAVEVLGFEFHGGRGGFDRDARRNNLLTGAGWTVVTVTSAMSDAEIEAAVAATLDSQRHGRTAL